jgi:signal transduction histidine kinase
MSIKLRFTLLLGLLLVSFVAAMAWLYYLDRPLRADRRQTQVFIAFGALAVVAVVVALRVWVLRPLDRICESVATGDSTLARDISGRPDELGRIAQWVVLSAAQRETLEREVAERTRVQAALKRSEMVLRDNLEERARLGRDLHDGVIQSLYAAGMGLAGIRVLLRPDQTEAAARLEQTREALNATIHDVRNFIIGLEPEALKLQTFTQAVSALLELMRGIRPFRSTVEIDEPLAGRLTLAQRVHALQIMREAVSNALRHGSAEEVNVALRGRDERAEIEISDNGRGFDAASSPPPHGRGLANFAQRARELGGVLDVASTPGAGTRVKLTFSQTL